MAELVKPEITCPPPPQWAGCVRSEHGFHPQALVLPRGGFPAERRKGWEGMGALRKINANPCHFLGLVTGVGAGGLWRAGKPEKGQTLALTEAGHSQGRLSKAGMPQGSQQAPRPGQPGQILLLLHREKQGISGGEVQGQRPQN